jgi:hypothetical protein
VTDWYACFDANLERVLAEGIGAGPYEELFSEAQEYFDYASKDQAQKSPQVLSRLLTNARQQGHIVDTLTAVVQGIASLRAAH